MGASCAGLAPPTQAGRLDENRPWRGFPGTVGSPRTPLLQGGGHVHVTPRSRNTRKGETSMTISGLRPRLVALLTAIIAGVSLLSLSSAPAWAVAGTIKEFPIPTKSAPIGITAGPDGNLWFTEITQGAGEIGRITPSGRFTVFPVPTASSMPEGITAGPDGALWFTGAVGKIGRSTTAGAITEFRIKTKSSLPLGIAAGPDGNLWFAELHGNKIGRITPAGVITEFHLIAICVFSVGCGPDGITAGSDGNLWFTEFDGNAIGRITPSGSFSTFGIPTAKSRPEGITAGPDGNVWFVEENASKIGRITT